MNATNLYTRSRFGLDNRVWLALLLTLLLSVALLAFKIAGDQPCTGISITVMDNEDPNGTRYYPQDRLTFSAVMTGGKDIAWDFGDNTPIVNGKSSTHSYAHAGNYFVTVTVNGKCKEMMSVFIHPHIAAPVAPVNTNIADISGPDAPKAGEAITYTATVGGTSYEWNVLNSPEYPTQNTPVATYTFLTPGAKIIELKMDGTRVLRKSIQVLPSDKPLSDPNAAQIQQQQLQQQNIQPPPQEDPTPPEHTAAKSTFIADEVFRDMLDKVTEGEKDASSFNQYLCSGAQTKVRDNGESWTTLGEFCSKIHDKKKFKIKSVVTIRDPNDKCVLQIQVTYKKKGFLGL